MNICPPVGIYYIQMSKAVTLTLEFTIFSFDFNATEQNLIRAAF